MEENMYQRYILSNGIRVVAEYIPYVDSISMGVWIGSGSRYENPQNNGVSHFIEHMMFKGTENRSAKKIAEDIEELGGQINAFTGKEATCYYVKLLDEHIDVGIDVLSDMLINSKFAPEDIEKEKSVIQEEINMYEDSPEDLVVDILSTATWDGDALSYPILGTESTIKSFSRNVIVDYYNKTYVPNNTVISITGNFDENEIIKKLENKFGSIKPRQELILNNSSTALNRNIMIKNKDIEQVHIALTLNGIQLGNDKLYTLLAINNFIGGGTSSLLFQKLREEYGYVYTIYSFPSSYKNVGMYNVYFALNEQYIKNAIDIIYEIINDISKNKMTEIQVHKAKEQLKGSYILGLESISSRMFGMGKSQLMLNNVYEPREILEKIDNITQNDINEIIEYVFNPGIISAAAVGRNLKEDVFKSYLWR
jgi:predicted Zn-dependent peptidase